MTNLVPYEERYDMAARDDDQPDLLVRLRNMNPTVVVVATVALFLVALLLPDLAAAVVILAIAAGLGWLLSRTWPVLPTGQRVIRAGIIGLLVAVALVRVFL